MPLSNTSSNAAVKRPAAAFFFFALVVFATGIFVSQWLASRRMEIFTEWERHERSHMALIVQKIARFSQPETYFPFVMRQAAEMMRKATPGYAFELLRPLNADVDFLFFDDNGRRVIVDGFRHEKVAVSEQVMAFLLKPESFPENRRNALSGAFIGRREALLRLSQRSETLITLKGCSRYSHAGWWRITQGQTKAQDADNRIAHVVVLVSATAYANTHRLLKNVLSSVSSSLPARYQLEINRLKTDSTGRKPVRLALRRQNVIEEKAALANGMTVTLRRYAQPDFYYRQLLSLWDLLVVVVKSLFILVLGIGGKYLFTATRQDLSLARVISGVILTMMIPVLVLFSQWCFDYLQTSTSNTVRQQHRHIERSLNSMDRGLLQHKAALEKIFAGIRQRLENDLAVAESELPAAEDFKDNVDAIYLIDNSGEIVRKILEVPGKGSISREVASFLITNLVAHLTNVSPKKSQNTFNLSYIRSFSHDILQNLGRLMDLNWTGYRRGIYVTFIRNSAEPSSMRFLVALCNPDNIFREYLAELAQTRNEMRFGVVEMTENGPKSSMPDQLLLNADLLMLSEEVWRQKRTIDRLIELPGRGRYLVTGVHARNMGSVVLVGATPFKPISQSNHRILSFFFLFVAFSFCSAILSALYISSSMGASIRKVAKALENIKNHRFAALQRGEDTAQGRIFAGIRKAAHTFSEIYDAQPIRKKLVFEGKVAAADFVLESCFQPGKFLGGDYIEALPLPENRLLFCIGEIAGKPIPATLMIARIKMYVALLEVQKPDPEAVLLDIWAFLERERRREQQIRLLCAITGADGRIEIASAGHYPPVFIHGRETEILGAFAQSVGESIPAAISRQTVVLPPGATLLFVTSGFLKLFDRQSPENGLRKLTESFSGSDPQDLKNRMTVSEADSEDYDEDRSLVMISRIIA